MFIFGVHSPKTLSVNFFVQPIIISSTSLSRGPFCSVVLNTTPMAQKLLVAVIVQILFFTPAVSLQRCSGKGNLSPAPVVD